MSFNPNPVRCFKLAEWQSLPVLEDFPTNLEDLPNRGEYRLKTKFGGAVMFYWKSMGLLEFFRPIVRVPMGRG
jgi:hypothetical protein